MWPNTPPGGGSYRHSAYEWFYSRWRIIPAMCPWMSLFQVEKHWHCAYDFIPDGKIPAFCLWMNYSTWSHTCIGPVNEFTPAGELYRQWTYEWFYSRWKNTDIVPMNDFIQMEKYRHCAYEWVTPGWVIPALGLWMSLLQVESYTGFVPTNEFDECSILSLCGDRRLCVEMPPPGV